MDGETLRPSAPTPDQIRDACEAARLTEKADPDCVSLPCCAGDHPVANAWLADGVWRLECQLCDRLPESLSTAEVLEATGLRVAS